MLKTQKRVIVQVMSSISSLFQDAHMLQARNGTSTPSHAMFFHIDYPRHYAL